MEKKHYENTGKLFFLGGSGKATEKRCHLIWDLDNKEKAKRKRQERQFQMKILDKHRQKNTFVCEEECSGVGKTQDICINEGIDISITALKVRR